MKTWGTLRLHFETHILANSTRAWSQDVTWSQDASLQFHTKSQYLLVGDFFMIWRLIKDFKSDIVFSVGFDYDIDT